MNAYRWSLSTLWGSSLNFYLLHQGSPDPTNGKEGMMEGSTYCTGSIFLWFAPVEPRGVFECKGLMKLNRSGYVKKTMRGLWILAAIVCLSAPLRGQKMIGVDWDYAVSCQGLSTDGSYIVSVSCSGLSSADAKNKALKSAVHCVLFKGIDGSGAGCVKQPPIVTDPNTATSHAGYFKAFFSDRGGAYKNFATQTAGTDEIIRALSSGF